MYLACSFIFLVLMERHFSVGHQASVNKAPGLPLTVDLMRELIENREVGHLVAAEGYKEPALDPSAKGGNAE
jgi:hypothetical protein